MCEGDTSELARGCLGVNKIHGHGGAERAVPKDQACTGPNEFLAQKKEAALTTQSK